MTAVSYLQVTIVRITNRSWPGWVQCEFVDAFGDSHIFSDKFPAFSSNDEMGECPQMGVARCQELSRSLDAQGRAVVKIATSWPDDLETSSGISEFVVFASQLTKEDQQDSENSTVGSK